MRRRIRSRKLGHLTIPLASDKNGCIVLHFIDSVKKRPHDKHLKSAYIMQTRSDRSSGLNVVVDLGVVCGLTDIYCFNAQTIKACMVRRKSRKVRNVERMKYL